MLLEWLHRLVFYCKTEEGTGGLSVHLSPPVLCLIFSFVFVLHVQFCKAKSRCTLSQVVHQQHSVTVSYHSLLQYSPPCLLSSPLLLFLFSSSPVINGRGSDPVPPTRGSGLRLQPTLERCFPASLPAVTSCDFFFFLSPLAVFTPSRGLPSLSPVEDGAPDDLPRSPPPLSRLSAIGVRRGST